MKKDVFICYSHRDGELARRVRIALEANEIACWMDPALKRSESFDTEIAKVIPNCRVFLLLVSNGALESPKHLKRELAIADQFSVPVVAVFLTDKLKATEFHYLLATTLFLELAGSLRSTELESIISELRRLLSQLDYKRILDQEGASATVADHLSESPVPIDSPKHTPPIAGEKPATPASVRLPKNVALLYRRYAQPDEQVLAFLERELAAHGYTVFHDRSLSIGVEWFKAIEHKVRESDAVIPLVSQSSLDSEMLTFELKIAQETRQTSTETPPKPIILPVRIQHEGSLSGEIGVYLDRLQYFQWNSEADNEQLLAKLLESLRGAPPVDLRTIEMPGGAMPVDSTFYVEREGDEVFRTAIEREDCIVLVKGARQMGKTSLLARGLNRARRENPETSVAITDFQRLNLADFGDIRKFYYGLADMLADALDLEASIDSIWRERTSPNLNFEKYLRTCVLKNIPGRLIWAIDEADRLFAPEFGTEVFGLFRSWFNARQLDPSGIWRKLSLVIGYATEAHLFIKNRDMSPFNVGTLVPLRDFTTPEVAELNARHGSPLRSEEEIRDLQNLVGGQPFLVRRSLYAMAVNGTSLSELIQNAHRDEGLFGDHLHRFYMLLHQDGDLEGALRSLLRGENILTSDEFNRLRSAGLLRGESRHDATLRCGIYAEYLKSHLLT